MEVFNVNSSLFGSAMHPNVRDPNQNNEVVIQKASDVFKHTQVPLTTTTSVLGLTYDEGVVLAADIGGYYGSMARFRNLKRIVKVNDHVLMAASGDYADFQYIEDLVSQKVRSEQILHDGFSLKGRALYTWLTRLMYQRRSKFDPLWNSIVVAGFDDGQPFLGAVDKLGLGYTDRCISNGFGSYLAVPLMREALKNNKSLSKREAQEVLIKCMQVLYYRDTRSYAKYHMATVSAEGVEILPDMEIKGNWDIAAYVRHFE